MNQIAIVRTLAPMLWSALIGVTTELWPAATAWLADKPQTAAFLALAVAALWYLVAVLIGKRWPAVEVVMLGSAKQPTYTIDGHEPKHAEE